MFSGSHNSGRFWEEEETNRFMDKFKYSRKIRYGKCPKILYTKVPNKMTCANSADPDHTAPEGAV